MRIFKGVDELSESVGNHLGFSDWHTITQEQIDGFAEHTGDDQWIHVDPVKAAEGLFAGTIAHGYLTLSLVPMLSRQIYAVEGVSARLNYGANKLRFPSPVRVDSKVRAGVELLSVTPANGNCQVVTRITVECEGGEKPACVVETVTLYVP